MIKFDARDTVMVVDDNRDELDFLVNVLENAGITTLAATSGEAALKLIEHAMPHAIIMDARMGGMTGFETCQAIKQEQSLAHIPIVFLTGLTDTENVLQGLAAGGVDYITKPVIIAELIARLRVHISNAKVAHSARIALDATGRHLIAIDRFGSLLWATPQASTLLLQVFGGVDSEHSLPQIVSQRLVMILKSTIPTPTEIGDQANKIKASYLCEASANEFVFRLSAANADSEEDMLRREFSLTVRETEVLAWLTRGKSNQDISEILGISSRTVDKHLERVFAKLGVENRAAAASVALTTLVGRL